MLVGGDYDPLLAKVLVVAVDREGAIRRARRALGELETGGIQTTVPFHAWILAHQPFMEGRVRTDLVDRDWHPGPIRDAAARRAIESVARLVGTADAAIGSQASSRPVAGAGSADGTATNDPWTRAARREATERWP